MKKYLLVIYDLDLCYAENLLAGFTQRDSFPYDVKQVTDYKSLNEMGRDIDVLLLDETLEGTTISSSVKKVIYLSEELEDREHINRYQSVDGIITHLLAIGEIKEQERKKQINRRGTIGVYSPVVGCEQTSFTRELAMFVAANGGLVYWFDFNLVASNLCKGGADFYYDFYEGVLNTEEKWKDYFILGNEYYELQSSFYNCELWNVKEENIQYLLNVLRGREEEAYYIFDIGFINQAMIALMEGCNHFVMPVKEGDVGQVKVQNFKGLLSFCGHDRLIQNITEMNMEQPHTRILEEVML